MQRIQMPTTRVLIAYFYGAALVLAGGGIVYHFRGLKLIDVIREHYLSTQTPVIPMIGHIEIDTIGLFLTALGSLTLILTFISRNFRQERLSDSVFIFIINIFTIFFFLNGYICDDAFISFRTVDNFINGYGLRWNTLERVQTFTNPLWILMMSILYYPFHWFHAMEDTTKMYFISMALSYGISLTAVLFISAYLVRLQRYATLIILLGVLFSSKAFVEFTSSGLENPLTYLLIVLFYVPYFSNEEQSRPKFIVQLLAIASLSFMNRQDTVLLFVFPAAAICFDAFKMHGRKAIGLLAAGLFPAWGWVIFSLIYYGFPFPNSYYAKLGLSPASVVLEQGMSFFFSVIISDPLTAGAIFSAILVSVLRKDRRNLLAGMSLLAAVLYVISTGGDFMGGRFVSAPFLSAVLLIALGAPAAKPGIPLNESRRKKEKKASRRPLIDFLKRNRLRLTVVSLILYTILTPLAPAKTPFQAGFLKSERYGKKLFDLPNALGNIYQNSSYYYASNPMFYSKGEFPFGNLNFHMIRACRHCRILREEPKPALIEGGGIVGFCRGPRHQLIDPQAITDPLLARLPMPDLTKGFVPGHFTRPVPAGLLESYIDNRNEVKDPDLKVYYDKLFMVTRGPVFSLTRFKYILELNLPWNRRYSHPYI
jgi:arabinofuranosyltransferase